MPLPAPVMTTLLPVTRPAMSALRGSVPSGVGDAANVILA
jgi:hypothetical protein